jgi:hypothetical protein
VRRLFYVALGATAGVLLVRRLSEVANRWTPEGIANQAGGVGDKVSLWWAEVQHHAAERDAVLREALGLDSAESGD